MGCFSQPTSPLEFWQDGCASTRWSPGALDCTRTSGERARLWIEAGKDPVRATVEGEPLAGTRSGVWWSAELPETGEVRIRVDRGQRVHAATVRMKGGGSGEAQQAFRDGAGEVFAAVRAGDAPVALSRLEGLGNPTRDRAIHVQRTHLQGVVHKDLARLSEAIDDFRAARAGALSLGDAVLAATAIGDLGATLQVAGRHGLAITHLQTALEEADSPCGRTVASTNLGWGLSKAAVVGRRFDEDPADFHRAALKTGCADGELLSVSALNLALAGVPDEEAQAAIALAETQLRGRDALYLAEARAYHAEDVMGALDEVLDAALVSEDGEVALRVARARVRLAQEARDVALAKRLWTQLHEATVGVASRIPAHLGRDHFLAEHGRVAWSQLDFLVEAGELLEAASVMREVRGWHVRTLHDAAMLAAADPERSQAVDAWRESRRELLRVEARLAHSADIAEERRAAADRAHARMTAVLGPSAAERVPHDPAAGELWLMSHSHEGRTRWLARRGGQVVQWMTDSSSPSLDPLVPLLDGTTAVVLLVDGSQHRANLHLLPVAGRTLVEVAPVRWSVDVRPPSPALDGPGAIVADPRGDLPYARAEATRVADLLPGATEILGLDATRERVLAGFATHELLHVASHAEVGEVPWDAALLMALGQTIDVTDLLVSGDVPSRVVLSGCSTTSAARGVVPTLGLAEAFVLRGSSGVVGTVSEVADPLAAEFSVRLYEGGFASLPPEVAFAAVVRRYREEGRDAEIAAFRLITP